MVSKANELIEQRSKSYITKIKNSGKLHEIDYELKIHSISELNILKSKIIDSTFKNFERRTQKILVDQLNLDSLLKNIKRKIDSNPDLDVVENLPFKKESKKNLDIFEIKNLQSHCVSENLYIDDIIRPFKNEGIKIENLMITEKSYTKKNLKYNTQTEILRELNKLKNVYDSCSEEEIDEIISKFSDFQILPNSKFKKNLDFFILSMIVASCIFSPLNNSFQTAKIDFLFFCELFFEMTFIFDVFLNFFIGFHLENHNLVTNMKYIAVHYLTSDFFVDFLSSFPVNIIRLMFQNFNSSNEFLNKDYLIFKITSGYSIFNWLCFFRILKVLKYQFLFDFSIFSNFKTNRLLKFIILFIFIIHFSTCFWVFLGITNSTTNWIHVYLPGTQNKLDLYISSLYFNLVSIYTIGYGDIIATNINERLYCNILLFFGIMIFSFTLSSISSIFAQTDEKYSNYIQKKQLFKEIRSEYKFDDELKKKIKSQLINSLKDFSYNKNEVLESLPFSVKNDLIMRIYGKLLKNMEFFKFHSFDFFISVVPYLTTQHLQKNQLLFSEGEVVEEMYLVLKGSLSVKTGLNNGNFELCTIEKYSHIGDIFLQINESSLYEVTSKSRFTQVFVLKKKDFINIKSKYNLNIVEILQNSYLKFEFIAKKRKVFLKLFEIYQSDKIVKVIIKKINMFLMVKDFDNYYKNGVDFEEANDFFMKNDLSTIINLLGKSFFNQDFTKINKKLIEKRKIIPSDMLGFAKQINEKEYKFNDKIENKVESQSKKYESDQENSSHNLELNNFQQSKSLKIKDQDKSRGSFSLNKGKKTQDFLVGKRSFNEVSNHSKLKQSKKGKLIEEYMNKIRVNSHQEVQKSENELIKKTYNLLNKNNTEKDVTINSELKEYKFNASAENSKIVSRSNLVTNFKRETENLKEDFKSSSFNKIIYEIDEIFNKLEKSNIDLVINYFYRRNNCDKLKIDAQCNFHLNPLRQKTEYLTISKKEINIEILKEIRRESKKKLKFSILKKSKEKYSFSKFTDDILGLEDNIFCGNKVKSKNSKKKVQSKFSSVLSNDSIKKLNKKLDDIYISISNKFKPDLYNNN